MFATMNPTSKTTRFISRVITSPLLIYIIRCLIGFVIGYLLYLRFKQFEIFWALLSIILVISPEEKDSKRLSIERFKSNFVGSVVAMGCVWLLPKSVYSIMAGIVITIILCRAFKILNMARVAIVALLIIMIEPHHTQVAYTPIYRALSTGIGCIIGLTIVIASSGIIHFLRNKYHIFTNPSD
ncbi:Fusaric acid resistance protein-like [Sphingobacterium lactis]|uniref:Fusaric acid resistance protein-like n=1 Tax=Sphingobacterium lactis TaxID=797291 RepID=A0A1H5Y5D0_9SPHI|nr:Fusaric acid resistance protein-like [Sphingobacterium lactis]